MSLLEWLFRIVAFVGAAVGPLIGVVFAFIVKTGSERIRVIETKHDDLEKAVRVNQLNIKETEISMERLKTHISDNFCNKVDIQASLQRVHEKIEDGNKKTDDLAESVGSKIDQLRRDLQADIRSAITIARHQAPE